MEWIPTVVFKRSWGLESSIKLDYTISAKIHMHTHVCVYIYVCIYLYMHIYVHAYMNKYIYTNITAVTSWWFWFQYWHRSQRDKQKYSLSVETWPKRLFIQHNFYDKNNFPIDVVFLKWNWILQTFKIYIWSGPIISL